jgi:hypothetical protein
MRVKSKDVLALRVRRRGTGVPILDHLDVTKPVEHKKENNTRCWGFDCEFVNMLSN